MDGGGDPDYPAARSGMDPAEWRKTLEQAYERFCAEVDSGEPTFIDPYAAEHPAEFFAVMSEAFFTESAVLARDWPKLYAQLALFYKQDPARKSRQVAANAEFEGGDSCGSNPVSLGCSPCRSWKGASPLRGSTPVTTTSFSALRSA
jgi:Mlc titration factor MtfA (ptsG expression regulator)